MAAGQMLFVLCGLLVFARMSTCEDNIDTGTFCFVMVEMWFQTKKTAKSIM